eukprot:COSAG01_NODE_34723_length_543_cov_0.774775_1_plen_116_part_10
MRALLLAAALAPTPNPTGALDNGLGRDRPALGWSSWNHFSCGIHDTLFRQTADALVASGLRDAGYRYVNIVRTPSPRSSLSAPRWSSAPPAATAAAAAGAAAAAAAAPATLGSDAS